jgi:hypothetical protein
MLGSALAQHLVHDLQQTVTSSGQADNSLQPKSQMCHTGVAEARCNCVRQAAPRKCYAYEMYLKVT